MRNWKWFLIGPLLLIAFFAKITFEMHQKKVVAELLSIEVYYSGHDLTIPDLYLESRGFEYSKEVDVQFERTFTEKKFKAAVKDSGISQDWIALGELAENPKTKKYLFTIVNFSPTPSFPETPDLALSGIYFD